VEETLGQLRFLVVDDTEDIRDLMARMVELAGHVAEEAADGVEAVERLSSSRYDVMLLDLSMPRMSGEDVVRWLQEHPQYGEGLMTVVVTAWAGERRAVLQELGIENVLPKPLRVKQLREIVATKLAETS